MQDWVKIRKTAIPRNPVEFTPRQLVSTFSPENIFLLPAVSHLTISVEAYYEFKSFSIFFHSLRILFLFLYRIFSSAFFHFIKRRPASEKAAGEEMLLEWKTISHHKIMNAFILSASPKAQSAIKSSNVWGKIPNGTSLHNYFIACILNNSKLMENQNNSVQGSHPDSAIRTWKYYNYCSYYFIRERVVVCRFDNKLYN